MSSPGKYSCYLVAIRQHDNCLVQVLLQPHEEAVFPNLLVSLVSQMAKSSTHLSYGLLELFFVWLYFYIWKILGIE